MQHILNELTEPTSVALISLADMKTVLGIPANDTTKDAQLAILVDNMSTTLAGLVNRVFAFRKVEETFYEVENSRRLYFSQWPVKLADIESLTENGVDIRANTDWVLEEKTGTLFRPNGFWYGDVNSIYSGGYKLPEGAPKDLMHAATAVTREGYYIGLRGSTLAGVKMLAHKQARVMFYQAGDSQSVGSAGSPATWGAVQHVLDHYIRHWI